MRLVERLVKKEKDGIIKTKDLIGNSGTKKFIKVTKSSATIDHDKVDADSEWDGLHGVVTNLKIEESPASQVLERYRGLWQIEESFRINKHSLKMRPIYHFTPRRIRAHVLLCYLSYAVMRHTQHHLKKRGLSLGVNTIRSEINSIQAWNQA
jgi:transposase